MVQKYFLLLLVAVLLIWCCADERRTSNQKLAKAYCDCTSRSELVKLNAEAQKMMAQEESDQEALTNMLIKIEAQHQQLKTCLIPACDAFGRVKAAEAATFRAELRAKCPETDSMLLDMVLEWLTE